MKQGTAGAGSASAGSSQAASGLETWLAAHLRATDRCIDSREVGPLGPSSEGSVRSGEGRGGGEGRSEVAVGVARGRGSWKVVKYHVGGGKLCRDSLFMWGAFL